ncbi:hypothetical protein [Pandoraea apista]|uniref:hypothetical protein n=1 Tax=Pandoraea apista TaxID=93218 RepID=UPI000F65DC95|nr:hypothetical protein [Pandoraea apista]RRW94268.1 hypothetical protein EGJ54_18175 [Pandoraea apista]RRX00626.1 hypothetical protein EGJ56_18820 [Pandoraea apista]
MSSPASRTPQSLSERLVAHEKARHARRIKEIRKLQARLRLLNPVVETLESEHGIFLQLDLIGEGYSDGAIYISTMLSEGNRLHRALLAMGFKERTRRDYTSFSVTTVKKGRLSITVHVATSSDGDAR